MVELGKHDLKLEAQFPVKVLYESHIVGEFISDIVVENCLVLELKAQKSLAKEHSAQLINYLKASNIKDGLLLNFGSPKIEIKRLYGN